MEALTPATLNSLGLAFIILVTTICAAALAWAVTGWRKAARDIDQAVAMVCKPCSWTDLNAPCTCPDKGCTATPCPKRGANR